jgi:heme A synthase
MRTAHKIMRIAYKALAYLVAAEVAIQAMVMVWAIAGLAKWVDGGGVFDKSVIESQGTPFPEVAGIIVHGINGTFVVPAIALLLLIVSFFTKVRGAIKWAVIVFVLVVVQVMLGILGHQFTLGGALHGLNALTLFGTAIYTGRRLRPAAAAVVEQPAAWTAASV